MSLIRNFIAIFIATVLFTSCIQHKELVNFNEGAGFQGGSIKYTPLLLQPYDILSISVQSVDPKASAPFNFEGGSNTTILNQSSNNTPSGKQPNEYLIDSQGEINFPLLGRIKASNLTTQQLRDSLTVKVGQYIQAPIINVRLINFKFSVMGEVADAGTYTVGNEQINILQALGMAGDISTYGNRKKVLIIREQNGKREFGSIDLHQRDIFNSPYYHLMQNDVVYVEPLPAKTGSTSDQASKILQWTLPIVTVISIIVSFTR